MMPMTSRMTLDPPRLEREWLPPLLIFGILFGLYAWTAPRSVAFEDDGGFIMEAAFLGVSHPPGFPLWVLLAKLSTWIPIGSVAYRVHLLSGALGAGTCLAVWWIARTLTGARMGSAAAALLYGISPVMWSQSIIAEVYTLNSLLFFALFATALLYLHEERDSRIAALGLLVGFGLSNHHPLFILAGTGIPFLLWPARWRLLRRAHVFVVSVFVGLLPYLWLYIRSHTDPEISFYGPLRGLDEFIYFVARTGYAKLESTAGTDLNDRIQFAVFLARETIGQFSVPGIAVAIAGVVHQLRSQGRLLGLALAASYLGGSFFVLLFVDKEFEFMGRLIFRVYPTVSYGVLALWIAFGLAWIVERTRETRLRHLATGVALLVAGVVFATSLPENDRSDYSYAHDYAAAILRSLEPNAILFADTDADAYPIGYLNLVAGVRPDVEIRHYEGLLFQNRLFHARDGTAPLRRERARELIRDTDRPVYFMIKRNVGYGIEDFGLFARLKPRTPWGRGEIRVDPVLLDFAVASARADDLQDGWTRLKRDVILANYANLLVRAIHDDPSSPDRNEWAAALEEISRTFLPRYSRLLAEIELDTRPAEALLADLDDTWASRDDVAGSRYRARFLITRGRLLETMGRDADAQRDFERALRSFPAPENEAIMELLQLYARTNQKDRYVKLRRILPPGLGSSEVIRLDREIGFQ